MLIVLLIHNNVIIIVKNWNYELKYTNCITGRWVCWRSKYWVNDTWLHSTLKILYIATNTTNAMSLPYPTITYLIYFTSFLIIVICSHLHPQTPVSRLCNCCSPPCPFPLLQYIYNNNRHRLREKTLHMLSPFLCDLHRLSCKYLLLKLLCCELFSFQHNSSALHSVAAAECK